MISLCIIVKDDSEFDKLKRAVNSCVKYVDEVCITASGGKNIKKWCQDNKYNYSYFKWNNSFAEVRNFNYSQAKYNQFFLDTDDVVIGAENLPKLSKLLDEGIDWVSLEYLYHKDEFGRVLARHWKPRLTRKDTGKWEMSVHECFDPTQAVNTTTSDFVVIDHHHGNQKESGERNLRILLDEYNRDKDKTNPRTLFYLGQTLMGLGQFPKAAEFYTNYLKVSGWDEEKYMALHALSVCLVQMNEMDTAIDASLQAIKMFPNWSLAYFDLSGTYTIKQDYKRAIEWTIVGFAKDKPDTANLINDLDYTLYPMGRLADCYLMTGKYDMALDIARKLIKQYPDDPMCKELLKTSKEAVAKERFVKSFVFTAEVIRREDRLKAIKLFECIPTTLDSDVRIQQVKAEIVPPKNWSKKSIVIFCGQGNGENWAYPSIFTGIGGSEKQVIQMSRELTKLGYEITVYNNCGQMEGEYDGVKYVPFYNFNQNDNFNILIAWRTPMLFSLKMKAKKKIVWLHDIAYSNQFNERVIKNTDKFIFLSKWHRNNMPSIPSEKIFISNNGIVPEELIGDVKKKPNSLLYTASPDRGLLPFLKNIWPLIKKEIPDVTLDYCYGWQNIDKDMEVCPELRDLKEELIPLLQQEGVIDHGRISHQEVGKLYQECMVYAYASEFGETNCISSQSAQVAGCYVISTPQAGAVPEYLKFGELVRGSGVYTDKAQQKRYAEAVIRYLKNPKEPMRGLDKEFSVEQTAKTWVEGLL